MKKGRMKKAEMLLAECGAAYQQAGNVADREKARSMGPTLTPDQIYGAARVRWEEFAAEISRQARKGNPHAVKIAAGIAVMKDPDHETAFSDAWGEYYTERSENENHLQR